MQIDLLSKSLSFQVLVHKCNILLQPFLKINANFSRFYCKKACPSYYTCHFIQRWIFFIVQDFYSKNLTFWSLTPLLVSIQMTLNYWSSIFFVIVYPISVFKKSLHPGDIRPRNLEEWHPATDQFAFESKRKIISFVFIFLGGGEIAALQRNS